MQTSPQKNWLVAYTMPRVEKKVTEEINRMEYECYLPLTTVLRKWSDRRIMNKEPLFKSYVFVRSSMVDRFSLLKIPGILKFVTLDKKPACLPESEIERIRFLEQNSCGLQIEPYLQAGDKVRVVRGLFTGVEGLLIRKINKSRLVIRIPLLRQSISVEIGDQEIEKLM